MRRILNLSTLSMLCFALSMPVAAQQTNTALLGMQTENEARAWQAVGRLDMENFGFCTATLITSDTILTAAHGVFDKKTGKPVPPERMTFRAGLRNGTAVAKRVVTQVEAHPGYDPFRETDIENIRHDVALLRLAQPITTADVNPFVIDDRRLSGGAVSVVSYGRDREALPSRQDVCQVKDIYEEVILLSCDTTFGSSGAPVLRRVNGHSQIVSIISGGGTYQGEQVSYGMALPDLVAELSRQIWVNKPRPVARINRVQAGSGLPGTSGGGAKFIRP